VLEDETTKGVGEETVGSESGQTNTCLTDKFIVWLHYGKWNRIRLSIYPRLVGGSEQCTDTIRLITKLFLADYCATTPYLR
jgi:hypothetical protein